VWLTTSFTSFKVAMPNRRTSPNPQLQNGSKCAPHVSPFEFIYREVELLAKHHGIKPRCYLEYLGEQI
jgi:hypothetical protein